MSQHDSGARPRQVTIGGWVVAITSAVLVVSIFDAMAGVRSVATRERLTEVLTAGSGQGLGIDVADAVEVLRWSLFVVGVAAATTAVLGIFVLQRHTRARLVLTIAVVPIVLTAPFAGGFLAMTVGVAASLLWTRPARDWFAGRPVRPGGGLFTFAEDPVPGPRTSAFESSGAAAPPAGPAAPPAPWPPPVAGPAAPAPDAPAGAPAAPAPRAVPGWGSATPTGPAQAVRRTSAMPRRMQLAAVLTWVFSAMTGGGYLLLVLAAAVDREAFLDLARKNAAVQESGLSDDTLFAGLVVTSIVIVLWCLVASVLAAYAWQRRRWAWIALQVSCAAAATACLVGFPFSLVHLAACALTLGLLLNPEVRAWFRDSGAGSRPPAGPPPQWAPPSGPPRDLPPPS